MSMNQIVPPSIFREYIGAKSYPDNLHDFPADIINPNVEEFHFILAFATEDYKNGKGTGNFKRNWNVNDLSAERIKKVKHDHKNVKVVISIGGRGSNYPFNPDEKEVWIDNAKKTLKEIIQDYKDYCSCDLIDGIDINYEDIKSNEYDFAYCIGKVINGLKREYGLIKVVSIAPSDMVRAHYKNLYLAHGQQIDWVDYQFYDQVVSSTDEFIKLYREISDDYKGKMLAGFSTDPSDAGKISREDFLEGCNSLINSGSLPGIFVWDANDSAVPPPSASNEDPFLLEIKAQKLLTNSDN